jgi:hypothetical protein
MAELVKYPARIIYYSNCKKFLNCIKCIMNEGKVLTSFFFFFYLSNCFICISSLLNSFIPIFITLFGYVRVLHCCVCKSCFLLVLCPCISELCFRFHLYIFKKHNISNIYNETSVNILNFLNIGLHDWHALLRNPCCSSCFSLLAILMVNISKLPKVVTFLTCIWEVPSLNVSRDTWLAWVKFLMVFLRLFRHAGIVM